MDRGIRAVWYDLPQQDRDQYISWLHEVHIPRVLLRPGHLWAAHVQNVPRQSRLAHTDDPSVPNGNQFLLLFGATDPHALVDPSPAELRANASAETREMMDHRISPRSCIFVEVSRVDGPAVKTRAPGITPGPIIQLGTFNINALENEDELNTWYSRSRLPLMAPMTGAVGARKLVSISGWAKHAILYEFVTMEERDQYFVDTDPEWSSRVVANLIHAPGSPSLGSRIWPAA